MKQFQPSPLGVLKCNDLVELYYGFPLRTIVRAQSISSVAGQQPLLTPDPRRIKYEIVCVNLAASTPAGIVIGTPAELGTENALEIQALAGGQAVIERSWILDLDSVVEALVYEVQFGTFIISTRETILTPPGVDVIPLP